MSVSGFLDLVKSWLSLRSKFNKRIVKGCSLWAFCTPLLSFLGAAPIPYMCVQAVILILLPPLLKKYYAFWYQCCVVNGLPYILDLLIQFWHFASPSQLDFLFQLRQVTNDAYVKNGLLLTLLDSPCFHLCLCVKKGFLYFSERDFPVFLLVCVKNKLPNLMKLPPHMTKTLIRIRWRPSISHRSIEE